MPQPVAAPVRPGPPAERPVRPPRRPAPADPAPAADDPGATDDPLEAELSAAQRRLMNLSEEEFAAFEATLEGPYDEEAVRKMLRTPPPWAT